LLELAVRRAHRCRKWAAEQKSWDDRVVGSQSVGHWGVKFLRAQRLIEVALVVLWCCGWIHTSGAWKNLWPLGCNNVAAAPGVVCVVQDDCTACSSVGPAAVRWHCGRSGSCRNWSRYQVEEEIIVIGVIRVPKVVLFCALLELQLQGCGCGCTGGTVSNSSLQQSRVNLVRGPTS
jgi:hypothetical protein